MRAQRYTIQPTMFNLLYYKRLPRQQPKGAHRKLLPKQIEYLSEYSGTLLRKTTEENTRSSINSSNMRQRMSENIALNSTITPRRA